MAAAASNVIGTIRVRHPTMYVFTGGNEDAAFLSVYGFNLLLDGGDQKEVSYWNFIKNYDKISVVLSTRPSAECLRGISTILARKALEQCHPKIGAFVGNLPPRAACTGDSETAKTLLAVYEGLQAEGIKPLDVYSNPKMEPITLYEVLGEGALKMIVLNPERGSKESSALLNALKAGENVERLTVPNSIAVVLIWQPSDHSKPTIRILYPGACPLEKLYASLEKLKGEECLRHVEYVSADREKYSSNLSLNIRGGPRRSVPPQKPSSLRVIPKANLGASPKAAVSPKAASPIAKTSSKPAHSEAKARPTEHNAARPAGAVKKTIHLPAVTPPKGGAVRSSVKATATSGKPAAAVIGKDQAAKKATSAKPPAVPRKTSAPPQSSIKNETKVAVADQTASEIPASAPAVVSVVVPELDKNAAPSPNPADFFAKPQAPDSTGLLDGLEEPVQLRLISMDTNGDLQHLSEEKPSIGATGTEEKQTVKQSNTEERKTSATICDEPLPSSIGLSNLIMAENAGHLVDVSAPAAHLTSEGTDGALVETRNSFLQLEHETAANLEKLSLEDGLDGEKINLTEAKGDLDSVIQSLVSESKKYDKPEEASLEANGLPHVEAAVIQNGDVAEALQAQNALEDSHAREQYLQPVSAANRPQPKRTVGLVTKPKLSQPLYFDIVFVPHHGGHPALQDEVAAKAFAISVRSKRYVLSGQDAGKPHILEGFIGAKNVWNKPELEIDVLPTHSTDALHAFNTSKQGEMMEAGMNLRCPVDRCTVRLSSGGDADDACAAFKFEL